METQRPTAQAAELAVRTLLEYVGENPFRSGLFSTPARVAKALREMTSGYDQDVKEILSAVFPETYDEMVVLRRIEFASLCEHHILPFTGHATVGYVPRDRVVGISKLARLVECFAKRLQIQERMTHQIATAIQSFLNPLGVGVVISAHHECMGCRGVGQRYAEMVTSSMLGVFRSEPETRAEFMALAANRGR